jgi:hypothetical protein
LAGARRRADRRRADGVLKDEMGSNTSLFSLYAWAPRGERARCSVPRNRGKNKTLLASMTTEGMGPCMMVVGATNYEGRFGDLRRTTSRARPQPRRGGCDGQPWRSQGREGARTDPTERLRACVPAALLTGPQPARGGVFEGQGSVAADRSANPRGADRGDGTGSRRGYYRGCPRILRAPWLRATRPIFMTNAL